jgi:7-carboxy-7-deazaguanine synthase
MRVSEIYPSVQGEGPRTGQTTVFLRFGGCNLRCPGWPCDTQHAIQPEYRKDWAVWDSIDLANKVDEVAYNAGAHLITLTGGEPFLQPKAALHEMCDNLWGRGYEIEAFTNGTLLYPTWAMDNISMIVDWKMPGSGESSLLPQRIDNLQKMSERQKAPTVEHAVKFVCKDWIDVGEAVKLYMQYKDTIFDVRWYYGRVWDSVLSNADLVEFVMENQLPWSLNVQLHNYIWDPQERGR